MTRAQYRKESPDILTVQDVDYHIVKLLGKGKGGYSYLAWDDRKEYVVKQIHHEPCSYYAFGDKMEAEQRDYEKLRKNRGHAAKAACGRCGKGAYSKGIY